MPSAFLCLTDGKLSGKIELNHQQGRVCKMSIIKDYKSDKTDFLQKLTGTKDVLEIDWNSLYDSLNDPRVNEYINPTDFLEQISKFPCLLATVNVENNKLIILLPTQEQMEEVNG